MDRIKLSDLTLVKDEDDILGNFTSVRGEYYIPQIGKTGFYKMNGCMMGGDKDEDFRELISAKLMDKIGFPHADILLANDNEKSNGCLSVNILNENEQFVELDEGLVEYRPINRVDDFIENDLEKISTIPGITLEDLRLRKEYLQKYIFVSALIGNTDIKMDNMLIIKNSETGKFRNPEYYDMGVAFIECDYRSFFHKFSAEQVIEQLYELYPSQIVPFGKNIQEKLNKKDIEEILKDSFDGLSEESRNSIMSQLFKRIELIERLNSKDKIVSQQQKIREEEKSENNSLKTISKWDKIKKSLKELLGYKEGKEFLIDTQPYIKKYNEIELANIANIEGKLKNILEKNLNSKEMVDGLTIEEANKILEWVVQADRKCLNNELKGDIKESDLMGYCGLSQGIVYTILKKMGLEARVSNINPTITGENLGGHAFNSVAIPVKQQDGTYIEKNFLIDATYRQFFKRDNISISGRFIKDKRFGGKATPMAGYWCINLQGGKKFAEEILSNGFVELTPENAKFYGDSFILEKNMDKKFQAQYEQGVTVPVPRKKDLITGISGETYIEYMTDKNRQDYRGIDYDDEEIEENYGNIIKTPLMQKNELQKFTHKVEKESDFSVEQDKNIDDGFSHDR